MVALALVSTGDKYPDEYVTRLASAASRNMNIDRIVVVTDMKRPLPASMEQILIKNLPGWWAKMAIFHPLVRGPGRTVYIDLDTIVLGDLTPLAALDVDFAICGSFARAGGNSGWPCRYGSCVMVFRDGWGHDVWRRFSRQRDEMMGAHPLGDQQAIESIDPSFPLLQDLLPGGFFLNYRELRLWPDAPPADARMLIFGGQKKPHNCTVGWARARWDGR